MSLGVLFLYCLNEYRKHKAINKKIYDLSASINSQIDYTHMCHTKMYELAMARINELKERKLK